MITDADIKFFEENKKVLEALKGKKDYLPCHLKKGLSTGCKNLGATCYLNSLIQCLFHCKEFRSLILYAKEVNAPIIKEIQLLFAKLALTDRPAITTASLIESFGWNKRQSMEQHDAQEFFLILMDILSQSSDTMNKSICGVIQGVMTGTMH